MPIRVLVIDDERNIRLTLRALLHAQGHHVVEAATPAEALAALEVDTFHLCLLDLRIGTASGLELLPALLARAPGLPVYLMTAFATIPNAVAAIRAGARDYLPKPFTPEQLLAVVEEIEREQALLRRVGALEQQVREYAPEVALETRAPAMQAALDQVRRAAASQAPILLRGESGTGKGVIARALHAQSPRASGPFEVVNCPTLSEELLASELFGHVRGAFTGAIRDQRGKVELAEGGTLFLDEIGEISPAIQARLLRFLQERRFERVGDARTRAADVRFVAATNRDLDAAVRAGRFREDLLFRLNVVEITLPPLRARREDIPALAARFLEHFGRAQGRSGLRLAPEVLARLEAWSWPGNVRELRNTLERAVIFSPGPEIGPESLPERLLSQARPEIAVGADCTLEALEREHTLRVLARHATQEEAAQVLGVDPATLWRKRKRWEG